MTSKAARWVIVGAFLASSVFDLITFLAPGDFKTFEANPLFLATHSVALMVALKVVVCASIAVWLLKAWPFNKSLPWHMFAVTNTAVLVTFVQVLGGISNLKVLLSPPLPSQALPPSAAATVYVQFSFWLYVLPYAMSLLTFWLWDWAYHECRQTEDEVIANWIRQGNRGEKNGYAVQEGRQEEAKQEG
jgi:hypothetical protein